MNVCKKKIILKYTICGVLFGFLFPIGANLFEVIYNGYKFDLLYLRYNNPILIMIDTAPIFLGLFAAVAGKNQAKACEEQEKYKHLATYDELTGLYNRRAGKELLSDYLTTNKDEIYIFYIDLDNFKLVNDTLGHSIGDKVLVNVANKLRQFSKDHGYAMRIGGDEFIVVMRDVNAENSEGLAKMLHNYITTPILTNDNLVKLKGSIGVASCPHDACTIDELMFCADAAMFNAKRNQTSYSFYNEKFSENYKRKLFIKSNILNSINNDHFYIVYQPIINAKTLVISGVEALIRWNHPEEGDFYPSEFIPIAENNDSILKLGNWIIRKVCSDVESWREEGLEELFVSINISPNQIEDPNFSKAVLDIIKEYTIDTSKIKFEITENVTITNFYNTNEVMKSFEDLNIEWFIDDFGSGYTSLSMIKHLSIDCLKIDKSYINDVNMCNSSSQIVTAIHSLSTGLGMEVISEGVETDGQFERLKKIGTDYVQGYLFSRPLTYDELVKQYKEGRFSPYKINKNQ